MEIYNEDCITGMKKHIKDCTVDLIFTDPPYGIEGDKLDQHYNRKESYVVPGYVDVAIDEYDEFSNKWISECARVLKPGASMYIVSGYTGLRSILNALHHTDLIEVNHLIAQYTFGVSTKNKYVSSHYHVLYYVKPPLSKKTFNPYCRYSDHGDSYLDRMSVQTLKRSYKPKTIKNKNQLPEEFIEKFMLYSSNRGDVILDPFLGGFTTANTAIRYGREIIGFELNENAVKAFKPLLQNIVVQADPTPIDPTSEVLAARIKKRKGYRKKIANIFE